MTASATAEAPFAVRASLRFPALDRFLGIPAVEFFGTTWQQTVQLLPREGAAERLSMAGFDFRAVVAAALEAKRLEVLGAAGRSGPGPGVAGWPEVPNAPSARVTRSEEYCASLGSLCSRFTEEVSHRVNANLYVSPPQSRGLDRHRDGHDVLVLQLEGAKRWRIWPTVDAPPLDAFPPLPFEGAKRSRKDYRGTPYGGHGITAEAIADKPAIELEVRAGDLLYVPRGWPHEVWTEDKHSAHLTFGFHMVSWVDLLMAVVSQRSRQDAVLRGSLPIGFARVAPDADGVREKTSALVRSLVEVDGAEVMEEVIVRWMHRDRDVAPPDPTPPADVILTETTRLRRTGPIAFVSRNGSVGLFRLSQRASDLWMPTAFANALEFVATVEPGEFAVRDLPGVSPSSRTRVCEMLLAQGYLELVPLPGDPA